MRGKFLVILKTGEAYIGRSLQLSPVNGGWIKLDDLEVPTPTPGLRTVSWPLPQVEGVWSVT